MSRPTENASLAPRPILLIEEAVQLLRAADLISWVIYFAGAGAWVLGFLFFWAHTSWFMPSGPELAWSALGLVGLFAGLKLAQSLFCARLLALRIGAPMPRVGGAALLRAAGEQLRVHSGGLLVLPIALVLSVPFGWVFAFLQNATALGFVDRRERTLLSVAAEEARRWPGQNHLGLLFLSIAGAACLLNVASGFYVLPWMANRFLGLQNVFGLSGWSGVNTTFLAAVLALSWLATDPLIKAFYVLRVFYGRSQHSGEDLEVELKRSSSRGGRSLGWVAALVLAFALPAAEGRAEEPMPLAQNAPADPAALDRAIDHVLSGKDFEWQLRRARKTVQDSAAGENAVSRFFQQGAEIIRTIARGISDFFERVGEWFRDLLSPRDANAHRATTAGWGLGWLRMLLYVLIAALAVLIAALLVVAFRKRTRTRVAVVSAQPTAPLRPNLSDETVQAAQLPPDEWLALAREQLAKGEWRLAWRALYLATLARLAADGLLALAKFKTNLDYERELRRRAPGRPELVERFSSRRREFEAVWYGRRAVEEGAVRAWLGELSGGHDR